MGRSCWLGNQCSFSNPQASSKSGDSRKLATKENALRGCGLCSSSRVACRPGSVRQIVVACSRALQLKDMLLYVPVVLLSAACYLNSLNGDFVHDDIVAVTNNPDVKGQTELSQLIFNDFWGKPMADPCSHKSYRPLTVLTFRLNAASSGWCVWHFHVVNVLLHLLVVVLLTNLCRNVLLWDTEKTASVALLFGTHPIHTEAVSSIVGRAEVLSSVFFLGSFIAFSKCYSEECLQKAWLVVSMVCAIFSLLSKEQGITVLSVCFCYHIHVTWGRRRHSTERKKYAKTISVLDCLLITVFAVFLALMAFRLWMLQGSLPKFSDQDNPASFSPSVLTRFLTYSYLAAFNAWLLVAPITLSYDWQMGSIPLVESVWDVRNLATVALFLYLVGIAGCSPSKSFQRRDVFLSLCLLVLPFVPASNLFVNVGFVVAERVLYVPSTGFCILVTSGLFRIRRKCPRITWLWRFLTCLLVTLFFLRTIRRNYDWGSREALFKSGLLSVPQNAKVHYNYANLQKDVGNNELAIKHYRIALSFWPDHASAHNNLGTLLTEPSEAEYHFKIALAINPLHPRAHYNLAAIYSKQERIEMAIRLLRRTIELEPTFAEAHSLIAYIYGEQGRFEEAEMLHQKALHLGPDSADSYNNYGTFLQKTGRLREAVKQYQQAIRLQPNHTVALVNAAHIFQSLKNHWKAEDLYKRALEVKEDPQVLDNLAVLYISAGTFARARRIFKDLEVKYPTFYDGKVHYAELLLQERNYIQAEQHLLAVITTNSSHRDGIHKLSIVYSKMNRTTEALEYILRALSLCYAGETPCGQIHTDHGDILKDMDDLESAAESYKMAIELDPTLYRAHVNLAVVRHLQGEYSQALTHYEAALSLDPNNTLLQENMEKLRRQLLDGAGVCHENRFSSCQTR